MVKIKKNDIHLFLKKILKWPIVELEKNSYLYTLCNIKDLVAALEDVNICVFIIISYICFQTNSYKLLIMLNSYSRVFNISKRKDIRE